MKIKTHTIDATDESLGRLAVKISIILRGKDKPDFMPNKDNGDFVHVKNIKKVRITGNKLKQKIYYHHTGYVGNLKETSMGVVFDKDPGEVLKRTIFGMLPKNKLRAQQIKRLKVL
jgi:large subunit ribosomal protein L13